MVMERGWQPNVEVSPSCPRCGSSNTKFCYYNNYSLTQPRYFCKGCRRYWTKGGSLRNVPVGGGCRKNRRGKSLRLSSDVGITTKNFDYGIAASNVVAGSYGMTRNSLTNSPSSSAANDGSHIDLARVYANYLNQQAESGNKYEGQEFSSDQSDAHQLLLNIRNVDESNVHLLEPSSFLEYEAVTERFEDNHLNNNNHIYRCEIESFLGPHDGIQQYGNDEMSYTPLPLLPSEDVASQDHMSWSNPSLMGHDTLQAPDLPLLGGPESQDPNLLVSNWKDFDLPEDSFPGK